MEKRELTMEELDEVAGGVKINTGTSDKAQIRTSPTTAVSNRLCSLDNGTEVEVIGDPIWDDHSGRHFVEIRFTGKKGQEMTGYVAASIVGMSR